MLEQIPSKLSKDTLAAAILIVGVTPAKQQYAVACQL